MREIFVMPIYITVMLLIGMINFFPRLFGIYLIDIWRYEKFVNKNIWTMVCVSAILYALLIFVILK